MVKVTVVDGAAAIVTRRRLLAKGEIILQPPEMDDFDSRAAVMEMVNQVAYCLPEEAGLRVVLAVGWIADHEWPPWEQLAKLRALHKEFRYELWLPEGRQVRGRKVEAAEIMGYAVKYMWEER